MTSAGRTATVAFVAAFVMVAGRASAQDSATPAPGRQETTLVLHVTNYAALSRDILDVASSRVAMVYQRIGVRTVWVDGEVSSEERQDGRLHFSILLLSRDMAEKQIKARGIKDGVLGIAHPPSGRASIFRDRIATMAGAPTHLANPLGDVIAHEVGHLLLGVDSHSSTGIMRARTNVHGRHLQGFDKTQAGSIHTRLRN
jgi:hypothetical protein